MYWVAVACLVVLDAVFAMGVLAVAVKLQALRFGSFWRACLGGLVGIVLEFIRIFAAFGLTKALGVEKGDDLLLLLLNMRFLNIPWLVVIGFFVAMQSATVQAEGPAERPATGAAIPLPTSPSLSSSKTPKELEQVACSDCGRMIPRFVSRLTGGKCRRCERKKLNPAAGAS
jgi:hypothetical protein